VILVVGGAGYIGSHFVEELVAIHDVLVLDNLSTGHHYLVNKKAEFINGDFGDEQLLDVLFNDYKIEAVVHFAASSLVGESIENPVKYYENNVKATMVLLKVMMNHNVKKFIFSSTAATYGIPKRALISEEIVPVPINPYGRTKLMIEWMLHDFAKSEDLKYVILRYFNAAGAHSNGRIGEVHDPETHLIPIVLQHLLGNREEVSIYGNDYPTIDGTCIRDYVHVTDLASAHLLALEAVIKNEISAETFNLGNGNGYSVLDIIQKCEKVTNRQVKIRISERRVGDPARLVASSAKIEKRLGWKPQYDLTEIVQTAWNWHVTRVSQDSLVKSMKRAL